MRIIDFDMVTTSSLNRHAFALRKDVGKSKVEVVHDYLLQINPSLDLEGVQEKFTKENKNKLLSGKPDFVIDCIDDISTKVELIRYCYEHKIQLISSGGAGMKADPTKLQFRDIAETNCKQPINIRRSALESSESQTQRIWHQGRCHFLVFEREHRQEFT